MRKKDLGMLAVSYGNVYVAQIALGANPNQTLQVFLDAESYHGPSLILAYSQCIAHGINMTHGMTHQKTVVQSGFWPLYHYDPRLAHAGEHPFHLDSRKPTIPFSELAQQEARFAMVAQERSRRTAERLSALAQKDIDDQWHYYEQMAGVEREIAVRWRGDAMRADLSTNYLGLTLKNPVVASAGPLTGDLDSLRRLEQLGVAAAVLPSLFEEQICRDEQRIHALVRVPDVLFGRVAVVLSAAEGLQRRTARVSGLLERRQECAFDSGDRQPEWFVARRLGSVCEVD